MAQRWRRRGGQLQGGARGSAHAVGVARVQWPAGGTLGAAGLRRRAHPGGGQLQPWGAGREGVEGLALRHGLGSRGPCITVGSKQAGGAGAGAPAWGPSFGGAGPWRSGRGAAGGRCCCPPPPAPAAGGVGALAGPPGALHSASSHAGTGTEAESDQRPAAWSGSSSRISVRPLAGGRPGIWLPRCRRPTHLASQGLRLH